MNSSHRLSWRSFVLFLCVSVSFVDCSSIAINIFKDTDDVKLGEEMDKEIRKNPKEYPILQNRPDVKAYVTEISGRILASPEVKKRGIYPYKFEIIHNDSVVNAFATPGGFIYVYTGLLKFIDNEATLAGVLGHEIAHAERRHATQRITKYYGVQIVLSIVLGQNPSQFQQIMANLLTGIGFLKNSRADEKESDEYSLKYLKSTLYYPGAIKFFFEKIGKERSSRGGFFDQLLSTHPLPQERIDSVNEMLKAMGDPQPSESNVYEKRYQEFKRKLP